MFTLTSSADSKHWHYKADGKNLLWFFKDSDGNDGYTDTSGTYKYYLTLSSGNFTDAHVTSPSLEDTTTPEIFIFTQAPAATDVLYFKDNNTWVTVIKPYKKVSGSWVEQTNLSTVYDNTKSYVKG